MPGPLVAVLVGLASSQFALLLTSVVLHRAYAHKAVAVDARPLFVCRILIWITTGIRPRQWAAVHRRHHAFTDVEGDPHSPQLEGLATVLFGNVVLYRRVARDGVTVERYARDIPQDRWDRFFFDHAVVGLAVGVGLLVVIFREDWRLVLIAAAVHTVSYLLLNSAVNAIGHYWGRRPFSGFAGNSHVLAWLTWGEGFHSNHHAAPTSARLSFRRSELDAGWWAISLGRRLGIVRVRHAEARIKPSALRTPELV